MPRTEVCLIPAWGQCGHSLSGEWVVGGAAPFPELMATSLPKPHEEAKVRPPLCCLGGEASSLSGLTGSGGHCSSSRLLLLGGREGGCGAMSPPAGRRASDCLSRGRTYVLIGEGSFQTFAVRSRKAPGHPRPHKGGGTHEQASAAGADPGVIASLLT